MIFRLMISVLLIIFGYLLFSGSLTKDIPTKEELKHISGRLQNVDIVEGYSFWRKNPQYPVLLLEGSEDRYIYLHWFPGADKLFGILEIGDYIAILTDNDHEKSNKWVWQLERNGAMFVSYNEVSDAVRKRNSVDPIMGLIMLFAGLGFVVWILVSYFRSYKD
jgi:hypothetical protein